MTYVLIYETNSDSTRILFYFRNFILKVVLYAQTSETSFSKYVVLKLSLSNLFVLETRVEK